MAKTPKKAAAPKAAPKPAMNHDFDIDRWIGAIHGGLGKPKVNKVDKKDQLLKGTHWAVKDIIALLRNTAHGVKARHPRSSGRMFSDIAQASGNGEPVIEGRGAGPSQVGVNNDWWYPGGAPPGYPEPGPKDSMVVMESGTLWGEDGRQPWTDPGYPTQQELEIDPPDDDDEDPEDPDDTPPAENPNDEEETPDTGGGTGDDTGTGGDTETP